MPEPTAAAAFTVRAASWERDRDELMLVRRRVFVEEQGIPESEEMDDADPHCRHALAYAASGEIAGTGRLTPTGKVGRISVLPEYRRAGVGSAIVVHLVNQATELGLPQVYLHAQADSVGFYERLGFRAEGPTFDEVGIPHRRMRRGTTQEDGRQAGFRRIDEHPLDARGVPGGSG
jgi:predicted GNAT family N-acyltransferase